MLNIKAFERMDGSSQLWMVDDQGNYALLPLRDGVLESYMEAYALMPGEALELILLDWHDESVSVPGYMQEDMRPIVESILEKAGQIVWEIDRDETLAAITVSADTAPEVSRTWREQRLRDEAAVAGYQLRQEEIKASEFVDAMSSVLRSLPRSNDSMRMDESLGLSIKYVP